IRTPFHAVSRSFGTGLALKTRLLFESCSVTALRLFSRRSSSLSLNLIQQIFDTECLRLTISQISQRYPSEYCEKRLARSPLIHDIRKYLGHDLSPRLQDCSSIYCRSYIRVWFEDTLDAFCINVSVVRQNPAKFPGFFEVVKVNL